MWGSTHFPVPVWSFRSTSFPDKIAGMSRAWVLVGLATWGKTLRSVAATLAGTPSRFHETSASSGPELGDVELFRRKAFHHSVT